METIKTLRCIEVEYSPDMKKVLLTFLDEELGEVREVSYNKQVYKDGKFVDDPEKEAWVTAAIYEDTGYTFDTLGKLIDEDMPVYCYDTFTSLHHVDQIEKFSEDMKGEIFQTTIADIVEGDYAIKIRYEIAGNMYESKMTHGKYNDRLRKWFSDPIKKEKTYAKFQEKFLVPVSERETLIGKPIMVECKAAFGTSFYGDIKKLPRK